MDRLFLDANVLFLQLTARRRGFFSSGNLRLDPRHLPRRGLNPHEYLTDVLARLPSIKITEIRELQSRSVETSLREYLLKAGRNSGLFCGGYEQSLHGQTRSVFGFHLLLQQNPRTSASGGRNAGVLPSFSSLRASDDPDTRNARPHRANARAGPVDPSVDLA